MKRTEIIIIGTLHTGWTPHDELIELLKNIEPNNILVELSKEELSTERRKTSIRDEMIAAYDWATGNNIPVNVFDTENNILREGITGTEPFFIQHGQQMKKILKNYSWKDLNSDKPWNLPGIKCLDKEMNERYIDPEKSTKRDIELVNSIKNLIKQGKNVILIGAGHLDFLEESFPDAEFPLRIKKTARSN